MEPNAFCMDSFLRVNESLFQMSFVMKPSTEH